MGNPEDRFSRGEAHITCVFLMSDLIFILAALVDCRKFIEKDCLGVMLAALSSHDPSMRSAAYHIIERFHFHLEGARFLEVEQIQYIVELLKNSVAASRSKLACIVTVFLARAVRIMLKAGTYCTLLYFLCFSH